MKLLVYANSTWRNGQGEGRKADEGGLKIEDNEEKQETLKDKYDYSSEFADKI